MFSRFSETAKNSPFAAPFSVAKCSPEPTTQDRSSRIMAAPNIEGGKLENRHFSIVRCSLSLDRLKKVILSTYNHLFVLRDMVWVR